MCKFKDKYYIYFTVSKGNDDFYNYVVTSKSPYGPWENSPSNPLIHTYSSVEKWWSKGHASVIDTPDGKWWAVYHAYDKERLNQGRQTLLEPIELTADGWLKAPIGAEIDRPLSKPVVKPLSVKDEKAKKTPRKNKKVKNLSGKSIDEKMSQEYDFSKSLTDFRFGKEWKGWQGIQTNRFVKFGNPLRGEQHIGEGKDTQLSDHLAKTMLDIKKPLWILGWGGSLDLA